MEAISQDNPLKRLLRKRFDAAAAKSLAVINLDDAEPEMARFLHLVQKHTDQRQFVTQLFLNSFDDSYYLCGAPWEFLRFCMHALQWPEVRDFIAARKDTDVDRRGAASSTIWNDILQAFEPDWEGAKVYQEYAKTTVESAWANRHSM